MKRIGLLVLLVLLGSCNRETAKVLDEAESCMQAYPDSALSLIRNIDTTTLVRPAMKARFALLHAMALDKNWIDTTDVGVVMPAVEYYGKHGNTDQKIKAYYYLGRIQYNGSDFDDAMVSFIHARKDFSRIDDNRSKALVLQAMGDTYGMAFMFEDALACSNSAFGYAAMSRDSALMEAILFRIAQNYNNIGDYRKADSLYAVLIDTLTNANNPYLLSRLYSGSAITLTNLGNYGEALDRFERSLSIRHRFENYEQWGAYAYCLAFSGDIDKAMSIFTLIDQSGINNRYVVQTWRSRVEHLLGNNQEAYCLLEGASKRQTESVRNFLRQSVIKAQNDYLEMENYLYKEKMKDGKTIVLLVFIIILILLVMGYFYLRRLRERVELQSRRIIDLLEDFSTLSSENRSLTSKISVMEGEMTDIKQQRENIKQEFFLLHQSEFKRLNDLCSSYLKSEKDTSNTYALFAEVRGYLKQLGIADRQFPVLESRVNELFDDVMTHLRTEHPHHRERFYQISCYLLAGFKVRTVALIMGVSEADVYKTRSRLVNSIETVSSVHQTDFLLLLQKG